MCLSEAHTREDKGLCSRQSGSLRMGLLSSPVTKLTLRKHEMHGAVCGGSGTELAQDHRAGPTKSALEPSSPNTRASAL